MSGGFTLSTAKDGQESYRTINAFARDIIMFDILMPKMTGFDVLNKKNEDDYKEIPVLILTNLYTDTYDLFKNWSTSFVLMKVDNTPGRIVAKVREILNSKPKP